MAYNPEIKYGSIVSISHLTDDDALIGGDGFLKNSVILRGMSPFHKTDFSDFDVEYWSQQNIQNCLFIICPQFSNAVKGELEKEIPKPRENLPADQEELSKKSEVLSPSVTQVRSQPSVMSEKQVKDYQAKLFNEFKYNIEAFDKDRGQKVIYEQVVQFLHVASSKWLSCQQEEAKFENQNYRLSLSDFSSESTLFKITPAYKYQKDGDQIIYSTEIVRITRSIPLLGKPTYLHCSGEMIDLKRSQQMASSANKIQKREVNASLEESTSWKLNLFSSVLSQGGQDLIWIHHSETCCQLAVEHQFEMAKMKVSVHQSSLAELSFDNYSGNAYSLWIIESEDYRSGGPFLYNKPYRLKHFSSGLYLACVRVLPQAEQVVKKDPFGKKLVSIPKSQKVPATFGLQVIPTVDALFEFTKLKPSEKDEVGSDFIQIRNVRQNKYIDVQYKYLPNRYEKMGEGLGQNLKPVILNQKNEHAVFKLFKASHVEFQEIFFLDCCRRQLMKYEFYIMQEFTGVMQDDIDLLSVKQKKLKTGMKTILQLGEFIQQRIHNSNPSQKFGNISKQRQKLLKDLHFIEILVKIITQTVSKADIEIWSNQKKYKAEQGPLTGQSTSRKKKGVSEKDKYELAIAKVEFCSQTFSLLLTGSINNQQNQLYLYEKLPQYQHFCKYIPTAIQLLIEVVKSNEKILLGLSDSLRIDFDYENKQIVDDETDKKVKILINFYEKDSATTNDQPIPVKVHDRIIAKPINIINYFINLLLDETAPNKEDYMKFLRHICRFKTMGISQNQENLYKLYHAHQSLFQLRLDSNGIEGLKNIQNKQFKYLCELLQFFAEVCYGRNYVWAEQLSLIFKPDYLFSHIWEPALANAAVSISNEARLRPYWCKLATNLYVDQQPYNQLILPNYCRLYSNCDLADAPNKRKINFNFEVIIGYLKNSNRRIKSSIESSNQQDVLNDDLIFNTAQLIHTMLSLDIVPTEHFAQILRYLIRMFSFDRKSLAYLKAATNSYRKVVHERRKKKQQALVQLGNVFSAMKAINFNLQEDKKPIAEEEQEAEDQNLYDQPQLFLNPMMRGFMSLSYRLENLISLPKSSLDTEFKLKVCSIIDHFLDRRQNFLISNILVFFKHYQYTSDDLSDDEDDQTVKAGVKIFQNNFKKLLPNISRTGIDEIDQPPPKEDYALNLKKEPTFTNFLKEHKINVEESLDLDSYFSRSYKDDSTENVIASVFPYLVSTYFLVKDQVLEERCLNVIMRIFNQRDELRLNLKKVQVIFDEEKAAAQIFIEKTNSKLQLVIEQTEIWLSKFKNQDAPQVQECVMMINTLSYALLRSSRVEAETDEVIIMEGKSEIVDEKKQSIASFIGVHTIILQLIQNGMGHFIEVINHPKMGLDKKQQLFTLFQSAFKFLTLFCKGNRSNQLILFNNIETIIQYLQYDVGQCQLLVEIYSDNPKLLNSNAAFLVERIIEFIDREGRQCKFLRVLMKLMQMQDNPILENQILVINKLQPNNQLSEAGLRLLYSEGTKGKDLHFYLDDQFIPTPKDLIAQLQLVDWKDTYLDQPFLYHADLLELYIQVAIQQPKCRNYLTDPTSPLFREAYNISVFKIQQSIKAQYLLSLLVKPDSMVKMQQVKVGKIQKLLQMNQTEEDEEQSPERLLGYTCLKPQVVDFIRLIHICSQKDSNQESQISALNIQIILAVEFEQRKLNEVCRGVAYDKSYIIYLIYNFIPFLIAYHEKIITINQSDVRKSIQQFSLQFAEALAERLYSEINKKQQVIIIQKFKECYNNSEYDKLFMRDSNCCLLQMLEQPDEYREEDIEAPIKEVQIKQKKSANKPVVSNIFGSLGVSSVLGLKRKKIDRMTLNNAQHEAQWESFVSQFVESSLMDEQIELEKQALADGLTKIEQLVTEPCEIKPNLKSILKKLINFLQLAVLQQENKDTIVILLKIMCKIILKDEDEKKIVANQVLFNELGATRMVLNVLTDYAKIISNEMFYNLLLFINILLQNGNNQVQKTIYNFCLTQQKSEIIFQTFARFLKQAANAQQSENEDEQEAEMRKNIVNAILKFLQNCAEGHYLELQDYIRYQSNSRASIDMINIVADLFKNQERSMRNFSNLLRCLDTLNELVQGPCSENQIAVADSKFFDVVQEIFPLRKQGKQVKNSITIRSKGGRKQSQKAGADAELTKGMIAQLQNKILVLVLSLLEKREIKGKNSIIKRIMRVLPVVVIEKYLSKTYKKWNQIYNNEYVMEAFDHIKEDLTASDINPKDLKHQTIIQNGFYLMFLFCYYLESEDYIDSPCFNYNKQYLRSQIKENNLFDPNSTLGQLFSLGLEIFERTLQASQQVLLTARLQKVSLEEKKLEELKQKNEEKKKRLKKAFMFFRSKTAHIEVVREQIELVYFPLLPYSKLNKEEKTLFQVEVNRSSAKSKVQDLLERKDGFIEVMQHEEKMRKLYKQYPIVGFFANYIQLWKDLAFYLTLVINIFILGSYAKDDPENEYIFFRKSDWDEQQTKDLFQGIGIAMTICSLFVVLFVLAKIAPLLIVKSLSRENVFQGGGVISFFLNWLVKFFFVLFNCLKDFTLLYYLGYGVLAVLGTFSNPFYFCFHLTVILIRYPTLSNVVKSVTQPKVQLILTLLLIIILTYIASLVVYILLQDDYEENCKEVYICFLYIFDMNFKVPGGIGGQMTQDAHGEDDVEGPNFQPVRYIFDQINNLLLVIIMINIASGIIIDTFGQLREEENKMQSDIKDKCFICGQENIKFERSSDGSSGGFKNHIRQNHYMWNYLYYIAYLKWKDKQDYSGIESYVAEKLKDADLSWIPFNKARELERGEDQQEKQAKQIEAVSQNFDELKNESQLILLALKQQKEKKHERHHSQTSALAQQKSQQ